MRAGSDPINVDIDLQLDDKVGELPLVAEDFSRVILNLVNNAFDAMGEKSETSDVRRQTSESPFEGGKRPRKLSGEQGDEPVIGYRPKLTVRTIRENGIVTIEIEDNGPGIPDDIKDKILQPFFTTKKGTQGTGLGLSITNDIVKAHGGHLDIMSQSGKTIFMIKLNRKTS
jgi:signal transduction histidine kinase